MTIQKLLIAFLLIPLSIYASSPSWIEFLAAGKDVDAAKALRQMIESLPKGADFQFKRVLLSTAAALEREMNICPEESKIYLFRTTQLSPGKKRDHLYGRNGRSLLVSRMLRNRNFALTTSKMSRAARENFYGLLESHSQKSYYLDYSPFISTSYSPLVGGRSTSVILKVCPQRVIASRSAFSHEFEVIVPFFIHPKEIVAVVNVGEPIRAVPAGSHLQGSLETSQFEFLYKGDLMRGLSDREARAQIVDRARKNRQWISRDGQSGQLFDQRFKKLLSKQLKAAGADLPDLEEGFLTQEEIRALSTDLRALNQAFQVKAQYGFSCEEQTECWEREGLHIISNLEELAQDNPELQLFLAKVAYHKIWTTYPISWEKAAKGILNRVQPTDLKVLSFIVDFEHETPFDRRCKRLLDQAESKK